MNVEYVSASKLAESSALIEKGGDNIVLGIAYLLESRDEYIKNNEENGRNCSQVLNAALKKLGEDPYLTLGVAVDATETAIKKSYRKKALKYHPDKNAATSMLFTVIQAAYDILSDADKKKAYDAKKRRHDEALNNLRKRQPRPTPNPSARSSWGRDQGPTPPAHQAPRATRPQPKAQPHQPGPKPTPTPDEEEDRQERQRDFNRRFFREYKQAARTGTFSASSFSAPADGRRPYAQQARAAREPSSRVPEDAAPPGVRTGVAGMAGRGGAPMAPSKPKSMRVLSRGDTHVTLEWHCDGSGMSTAFELQWRKRGGKAMDWTTAPTLVLGTTVRKKNLEVSSCYEFRVRAASAWGWSAYSDPLIVVTAAPEDEETASFASESKKDRRKSSAYAYDWSAMRNATPRASATNSARASNSNGSQQSSVNHGSEQKPDIPNVQSQFEKKATKGKIRRRSFVGTRDDRQPWVCTVCKRENNAMLHSCSVCYTKKNYNSDKLGNIKAQTAPRSRPVSAAFTRRGSKNKTNNGDLPDLANQARASMSKGRSASYSFQDGVKLPNPGNPIEVDASNDGWEGWRHFTGQNSLSPNSSRPSSARPNKQPNDHGRPLDETEGMRSIPSIRVFGASFTVDASGIPKFCKFEDMDSMDEDTVGGGEHTWKVGDGDDIFGGSSDHASSGCGGRRWSFSSHATADNLSVDEDADGSSVSTDKAQQSGLPPQHRKSTEVKRDKKKSKRVFRIIESTGVRKHFVRQEPIVDSSVIGEVTADKKLVAVAEAGDWVKVRYHTPLNGNEPKGYGWCLQKDTESGVQYLQELRRRKKSNSHSEPLQNEGAQEFPPEPHFQHQYSNASDADGDDVPKWYELRNEEGHLYYFNSATGDSQWEPPLWINEIDPETGFTYYTNTQTGDAQWEIPEDFIFVVREEAYSTPASEFAKHVLSPKKPYKNDSRNKYEL